MGQQGEVVVDGLGEADAGVDPDLLDAGGPPGLGPLDQELAHLGHHVFVVRLLLHGGGLAFHVHGDPPSAGGGRHRVQGSRHVVDEGGPRLQGRLGHGWLAGVDRHPHPLSQLPHHGHDPRVHTPSGRARTPSK